MTKPKEKPNANNSGKSDSVGRGKSGPAGKDGNAANPPGSIAGPAASEPVADGNGKLAGKPDGGAGEAGRDPATDAAASPKPKRGRHTSDCPCPRCADRRLNPPPERETKASLVLNNKGWAEDFYGLHQVAAVYLPIPDPTRPGQMLVTITMEQSHKICDQAYTVAEKFDLLKYLKSKPGKWGSLGFFGFTMGVIYIPKIKLMAQIAAMMKQQQQQQQQQNPFEAPQPQPPESGERPEGVFKYEN
jgi:hypothetical protein